MGSRSKWEDMVTNVQDSIKSVLTPKDTKPEATKLGSGMAENAKNSIMDYKERQRKAIQDATGE